MEYYDLGQGIKAFTTDRTVGRDGDKIRRAMMPTTSALLPIPADFLPVIYPHQTHTDRVYKITRDFLEREMMVEENLLTSPDPSQGGEHFTIVEGAMRDSRLEGIDAVISDVPHVVFGISTADCIPVIVFDPEHHAAAAIHAGWKGTVQRIVEKAIAMMQKEYGTSPTLCTAAIGPGISQESFEVGQEVVDRFSEAGFAIDGYTIMMPNTKGEGMKPHIDLKQINKDQLIKMGLKTENIVVSPIDTFTDERFFSARREQKDAEHKCGRILSGFLLQ